MNLRIGDQSARQARAGLIEPLARQREQRLGRGQGADRRAQLRAPGLLATIPAGERPLPQAVDAHQQLRAHRHRPFGGRGRRRRAHVGGEVDQRHVGLVADRGDQRDHARGRRPHDDLIVERPQILERAAAARDDEQVGSADRPVHRQRVEAHDGGGDLLGGAFALHAHRPHQHVAGEPVGKPMQNVADNGTSRRGNDADQFRQERQRLLSRCVEQAFGGELFLALFDQRHQRAEPRRFQRLDHDLVFRLTGIGRQASGDEDFEPFLRLEAQAAERSLPDHRLDLGARILQREIAVAGGMRSAVSGDFAAHAHIAEGVLDGLLERRRELGDGPFGNVKARLLVHCNPVNHHPCAASTQGPGMRAHKRGCLRKASLRSWRCIARP